MSCLVDSLRSKLRKACLASRCKKQGCKVGLTKELSPFVLIDMDRSGAPVKQNQKRCDYLFVGDRSGETWVVPMELMKGKATASKIVPQLRAGASIAEKLVPDNEKVRFRPVAAYGRGLTRYEFNQFKKMTNRVKFGQVQEFVHLIKCGSKLKKAL